MSTLKVNNITDTSGGSTNLTIPNTAKAWVNFNGTGTVAIRANYNVSSITDNGTGNYSVNLTTAMLDANYAVVGTCNNSGSRDTVTTQVNSTSQANVTSGTSHISGTTAGVPIDKTQIFVVIFR